MYSMAKKWTTNKGSLVTLTVSGRNNVYLVESGGVVMLVDVGMGYMYDNLLLKIKRANVTPGIIAITHAHYDHAENTLRLKDKFNAKVLVHAAEAPNLAQAQTRKMNPWPGLSP
jgi:glyoxylase-like metal-dependent hydrolase (beta-lactamase superfamily II)